MGMASFIAKKFMGEEICIYLGDEAESIKYEQASASNKMYLRGVVVEVYEEDDVVGLEIDGSIIYVDSSWNIKILWRPGFDIHKATKTSLTRRMVGARRKD